ncbi:histamine N-methyltransferase-like isoform X3 [Dunckerocampus dactyliophorus]|uniref:histamine N-methyltransferase-like isoform X3 n=1 Tax=Dunckerocampus dactyliophorus TaxID=161453 RepID=UPI0024063321|nr:histamine N-methyltransferase-like isoform X3 [Dunckerocampus dactyliophorus]
MASPLRSLVYDDSRYQKAFHLFLECSSEHQCMQDFIHKILPEILAGIGDGKSHLNVIGVGSGDVLLAQKSDLDYITFNWNKMTSAEFEDQWKSKQTPKKADFIHMIQMLYYVKDVEATIRFFQSLLDKHGKLLIILVSGESGWGKLWKTFRTQLCMCEISQCVTTADVKSFLDSEKLKYKSYALPSQMDITECFTEGDEKGELLLDFLTETDHFSRTASPQLKADVLKLLRDPACSLESNGRVIFNNTLEVIIVDATT